jgi:Flp pilus assembly pilin Flp
MTAVQNFRSRERGATLIEYALLLALIGTVCVAALSAFGSSISSLFRTAATTI